MIGKMSRTKELDRAFERYDNLFERPAQIWEYSGATNILLETRDTDQNIRIHRTLSLFNMSSAIPFELSKTAT